ncbi:hypothetical protein DNH61_25720 [Paenibacillus sambharensis]|uniref:N-acetyltransferase domain-containing protein n=1 Tax=Paenibacillus sambharensis TaxID=1803190 RepID=A0A2W1KZ20_9BACL|nr:GNAT family N-acetyltransferase [Paenibacillus sambharensis]PZD92898.1 hypothetical protein DNH61_25720 [Paenibacillus sambharensis]
MIEIRQGFGEKESPQASRLYVIAFKRKFEKLIGEEAVMQEMFEKAINPANCLCAYDEYSSLVGISGFHKGKNGLIDIKLTDFIQSFGLVKGLWKAVLTDLIFSRKALSEEELLMDGIAVDTRFRGQGIGSQLFEALMDYGKNNGYKHIQLDVIDENPRAKALYERVGFKKIRYQKVPAFIAKLIGVTGVTTMVKEL